MFDSCFTDATLSVSLFNQGCWMLSLFRILCFVKIRLPNPVISPCPLCLPTGLAAVKVTLTGMNSLSDTLIVPA